MENIIRDFCVFLLLATTVSVTYSAPKILISRYQNWSHPVLNVFNRYSLSLYKIRYCEDGTCPIFYLNFKHSPAPDAPKIINYHNIYFELLKANFDNPYVLIDKADNLKINVGWEDEAKIWMKVNLSKASSAPKKAHFVDSSYYKI